MFDMLKTFKQKPCQFQQYIEACLKEQTFLFKLLGKQGVCLLDNISTILLSNTFLLLTNSFEMFKKLFNK